MTGGNAVSKIIIALIGYSMLRDFLLANYKAKKVQNQSKVILHVMLSSNLKSAAYSEFKTCEIAGNLLVNFLPLFFSGSSTGKRIRGVTDRIASLQMSVGSDGCVLCMKY